MVKTKTFTVTVEYQDIEEFYDSDMRQVLYDATKTDDFKENYSDCKFTVHASLDSQSLKTE